MNAANSNLDAMSARMDGFSSDNRVLVLSEAPKTRLDWALPPRPPSDDYSSFSPPSKLFSAEAQRASPVRPLGRRWAADLTRWRKPHPLRPPTLKPLFTQNHSSKDMPRLSVDAWVTQPCRYRFPFVDHLEAWQAGLVYGHRLQWLNRSR